MPQIWPMRAFGEGYASALSFGRVARAGQQCIGKLTRDPASGRRY